MIEDVVISLLWSLEHHSGFLQQIRPHVGTDDMVVLIKEDLDVLAKPAAVIISYRLSIPNGLQEITTVRIHRGQKPALQKELQTLRYQSGDTFRCGMKAYLNCTMFIACYIQKFSTARHAKQTSNEYGNKQ